MYSIAMSYSKTSKSAQLKGGSPFSLPVKRTTAPSRGGAVGEMDDNTLRYKAMKYHYKIQSKLHEMQKQGRSVPAGYHAYLKPFQG